MSEPVKVVLEIDLMDMLLYDPFLGENFIKCIFRYYSHLNFIIKNNFIDLYIEKNS
jgi:hypothetical protein